jgi:hypothetical protein
MRVLAWGGGMMACMAVIAPWWWVGGDNDDNNWHCTFVVWQKVRPMTATSKHWLWGQRTANSNFNRKRWEWAGADDKGNWQERVDNDGKQLEQSSSNESGKTRPASGESRCIGDLALSSVAAAGGGGQRRKQVAMRQAAMATGGSGSGSGSGTCGGSGGRRLQWWRPALEEKERAAAAEPMCFFSVPCAYKNMVSLLPLVLPPLRPQRHNKICARGRARPRTMDCARFCTAQPLRPLY